MTPAVRKIFLYVLPPMSGAIMTFWPGGLQLVFSFTAMIALIQSTLLRKAWFRRFFGIQPLPEPDATKGHGQAYTTTINKYQAPTKSKLGHERRKGILGAWVDITSAVSETAKAGKNIMQSQRKDQQSRLTAAELRHAKLYEEKRRKELTRDKEAEMNERHLAQANFERRQEEEEKERSRKEERLRNRAEKKAKQLR